MHKYHLKHLPFELIKSGQKTIEGRLNKNSFKKIKVDDIINFINQNQEIFVKVIDIKEYSSFLEMLKSEDINKVTPLSNSIEDSLKIYRNCYNQVNENKYGVLALKIKLLIIK